jgi:parallel beta-helix repeat protein
LLNSILAIQSKAVNILKQNSIAVTITIFLASVTGLILLSQQQQQQLHYFSTVEAGEAECIDYDSTENTIAINCDASFLDVVQAIDDDDEPDILENLGNREYILNANLEVADGITFEMNSNQYGGLQYLKIAGANGIVVHGTILINGVTITSWDTSANDVIQQDINDGSIRRAFIQFDGSKGSQIINSEFGYLGYQELGKRGFDLWGPDASYSGEGSSHDMQIIGSEFHNMWFAFYSRGAYNVVVDGNEYHHNIKYALDPHSGTRDMTITNNWLYNNPIGVVCSDQCSNILIEGNEIENNTIAGIFFSRNMHDSIARNNQIYNSTIGITVSESSNNQIYNNTIEAAASSGIRLVHLEPIRDGETENNLVYNNTISNSENGIRITRSNNNNTVENHIFSNITTSEYVLSGNAGIRIKEQHFDDALIRQEGNAINNTVEIVDSGIIEVTEGETDGEEDEGESYDTDSEPYRRTLSDGDTITVTSSSS